MTFSLRIRCAAEFLGTAFLVTAIVGSGIMAERLSNGNVAIALLANAIATGATLIALILAISPISGAHLNPAVSLSAKLYQRISLREMLYYMFSQFCGGACGTLLAHAMFGERWYSFSHHMRFGYTLMISEFVATFGLICLIWLCVRFSSSLAIPIAVAAYITGAYWFTAPTSFANPAVTAARCITDTFAGIRPQDVPGFITAQVAATFAAMFLIKRLPDKAT